MQNFIMTKNNSTSGLRSLGIASLAVTLLFILSMAVCTLLSTGRLDIRLPAGATVEDYIPEEDGIVEIVSDPGDPQHMIILAKGRGRVFIDCTLDNDSAGRLNFVYVNVLPGGIVYDMATGNYSGAQQITLIVQTYLILITGLLLLSFVIRCRVELFSYTTLFYGGTSIFLLIITVEMLTKLIILAKANEEFTMNYVYTMLREAGATFMLLTFPVMALFAAALTVSNISLVRREGKNFANLLGIIMSGLIAGGYIFWFFLRGRISSGSEQEVRLFDTFRSIYSTAFVYFEAMLLSASVCGLTAAKKKPELDKTHIIILGCQVADDGTPLPLLQGRIDRAVAFSEEVRAAGGGEIKFVTSGGRGSDEPISEAMSMRNYLISKGISEDRILPEDRSTRTSENMRFSLEKIKEDCDGARIAFSTSDYHVLRSGIISQGEGLCASGIGSRTKWYFWPNAFVREFIGLLASKKRQHTFWIIFFILVFAAINMIMPM